MQTSNASGFGWPFLWNRLFLMPSCWEASFPRSPRGLHRLHYPRRNPRHRPWKALRPAPRHAAPRQAPSALSASVRMPSSPCPLRRVRGWHSSSLLLWPTTAWPPPPAPAVALCRLASALPHFCPFPALRLPRQSSKKLPPRASWLSPALNASEDGKLALVHCLFRRPSSWEALSPRARTPRGPRHGNRVACRRAPAGPARAFSALYSSAKMPSTRCLRRRISA
mmetsp:Transcript_66309/g.92270  ORF Transcript_66309/g.92270 Transcript_66309/m.92270 type:complete len:224 (+) Transcript_66309:148-819(+)